MNILEDRHGRTFDYVRIATIEHCNLRCVYCMPEEGLDFAKRAELLTTDEIARVVRVLAGLGVRKVRFTGGEPLLRRDAVDLVGDAAATPGVEAVHLTTNGVRLAPRLDALVDAGLTGVNVSLDTLRPARFVEMTRREGQPIVRAAIDAAIAAGLEVKVNAVIMRGFNDDEVGDFVRFTADRRVTVRFIELMPFDARQVWRTGKFQGAHRILAALERDFPTLERAQGSATEAHAFRLPGARGKVAVIPAYTRSLCGACNRLRLTADGRIMNCLYAAPRYDVRALLRGGADDAAIGALFKDAVGAKAVDGWEAQRASADARRQSMTRVGG